jgi:DNA-binding CsgD family transcriptional regulator
VTVCASPPACQFNCTFTAWHPEIRGANGSESERAKVQAVFPGSARERELVTQGGTNAQIAARLHISARTVSSHLHRIRDKTGARRRADLTWLALAAGLVLAIQALAEIIRESLQPPEHGRAGPRPALAKLTVDRGLVTGLKP